MSLYNALTSEDILDLAWIIITDDNDKKLLFTVDQISDL